MAQSSRKDRKYRKVKRELSIAYRLLDMVTTERNQARLVAVGLEQELKKRDVIVPKRSVAATLEAEADYDPTEAMIAHNEGLNGTSGQDRESYTDNQDRANYSDEARQG